MIIVPDLLYRIFQTIPLIFGLIGTYMLAYALHVKEGIADELRKEMNLDKEPDKIAPSEVQIEVKKIRRGLGLIAIGMIIQGFLIWDLVSCR